jgi:hypothetical protein
MSIDPKISNLFENIENYAKQYQDEKEQEKKDMVIIKDIVKKERSKPSDIRAEINSIPACDIACDIRPVTVSDK